MSNISVAVTNPDAIVKGIAQDKTRERMKNWTEEQVMLSAYLNDFENSVGNAERQLGRGLTNVQLEARLKKLNPSLTFEDHPHIKDKRLAYVIDSRGKTFLFPFEKGLMPEHTIFNIREKIVPDMDFIDNPNRSISRADLPKHEYHGKPLTEITSVEEAEAQAKEGGFVFDGVPPGYKKVKVIGSEAKRGWRTVLLRLIQAGLITVYQAETEFGADNRPEWQGHTGKSGVQTPW